MADFSIRGEIELSAQKAKRDTEAVKENIEDIEKGSKKASKEGKGLSDTLQDVAGGLGDLGGAGVGAFGGIADAIGMGTKAASGFKVALASTGIGLLVVAVGTLAIAFARLQDNNDKIRQGFAAVGVVANLLLDKIGAFATALVDAFTNPQQAIKDLWEALQANILSRLEGVINMFKSLGTVIQGVFELDTDIITQGFNDFLDSTVQVTTGVRDFTASMKELGAEISAVAAEAAALAKREQELDKRQIKSIESTARRNKEIARLKLIYEEEGRSLEEREEALRAALDLENQNLQERLSLAREEARIISAKNAQTQSTREDLRREAEAKAEVLRIEEESLSKQKEITAQLRGLADQRKALADQAREADLKAAQDYLTALETIGNALFDAQATAEEKELAKTAEKYDALLDLAVQNNVDTLEIEAQYQTELAAIQEKFRMERVTKEQEAQAAIAQSELDNRQAQFQQEEQLKDARLNVARQYFSAITTLANVFAGTDEKRARKAFALTKALGIAEATANTYAAVTTILKDPTVPTLGKPFVIAGAVATGLAQVAKIAATKFQPSGGGGASGGGAPSLDFAAPSQQQVPNIGAVQLGAQQQTIQAYVIEQNVSNSQQANQRIKEVSAL